MSKVFAVGDIHGCLNELTKMLEVIEGRFMPGDQIVFVGDYVDRGPDSKGVVELLLNLRQQDPQKYICLYGNHEDMLLEIIEYDNKSTSQFYSQQMGEQTVASYTNHLSIDEPWLEFVKSIPELHVWFFQTLKMNHQVGKYVFVHAGINPSISLENQTTNDMIWERAYVGYTGNYKDGHFVVFGHTPQNEPLVRPNQICIDTACCFGNKLTCAEIDLETDQITFHFIKKEK